MYGSENKQVTDMEAFAEEKYNQNWWRVRTHDPKRLKAVS